jgi:flavin reductase (DIM6/NTAB) family NADH-FMN oxidoreductase RutF
VAETKEEEPSLFLVSTTTVQSFTPPVVSVSAMTGDDSALMATLALPLPDVAHEDH